MLPEEKARVIIDKQLVNAGWDVVSRDEYVPRSASAVKEALMHGNTESDYLLFIEDKAIAVVEAKREENPLGEDVQQQAEYYACNPQNWYGLWFPNQIPLVYLANGKKIYFKNMLQPNSDYIELTEMHSPKKMLQMTGQVSEYGALPRLEKRGLRDCQYRAETEFEKSIKEGEKRSLAILATGSGKTFLAELAVREHLNFVFAAGKFFEVLAKLMHGNGFRFAFGLHAGYLDDSGAFGRRCREAGEASHEGTDGEQCGYAFHQSSS